jgi:hypothetical protein
MGENERKEVVISQQFDLDLIDVYIHGEDVFGSIAAKSFIADIFYVLFTSRMQTFAIKKQDLSEYYSWLLLDYL